MSMADYGPPRVTLARLKSFANVIHALMLRDIRTRMMGSAYGYLLVVLWPLSHILIIVLIHVYRGMATPYGDNVAVWVASGVVPFMCFSYIARFTVLGVVQNKPLLYFPRISLTALIFSRACIEILNSVLVVLCIILIFTASGVTIDPRDPVQLCYALFVGMLLGLGFGMLNSVIVALAPSWSTAVFLFIVLLWFTSGVFFVPGSLPDAVQRVMYYHPLVHVIEWARYAYFDSYPDRLLDRAYVLSWSVILLFAALVVERAARGSVASR